MNLERVLNGIARYLDREIYAGMNNWQEVIARIAVSRMLNNKSLENMLNNPYMRTFAIIDTEGNVDVDGLYRDLRTYISNKGKIEIELPIFGKFTFTESDVDSLYNCIIGG
ncbi:MAG: hypothetical protein IIW48_10175 [Clostridia bacterium]|nr:hypothetical protein [Clostridia bacterium]